MLVLHGTVADRNAQLSTGQVLGIVDGHDSAAVGHWLAQRSRQWPERVEIVAIDLSAASRKALRTYLPRAAASGRETTA